MVSILALLAVGASVLAPNFLKARQQGNPPGCKGNCKNLATALEMYARDHSGQYPDSLVRLTGGQYLRTIPTCPAAGHDTYSASYTVARDPDQFSFYCAGNNHGKSFREFSRDASNFPQYNSRAGLVDHP